jgi:YesN/AraC family two-component response regulator
MAANDSTTEVQALIIDDDQLVRDFAVHAIEYGTNRKVATFGNGFQAWQFIQNKPECVDIIIADANIPDMDGLELLAEVKKAFPDKKFIITTSNPAFEKSAYQFGADAFLTKPYDANDLFTIVKKFFSKPAGSQTPRITAFPNGSNQKQDTER